MSSQCNNELMLDMYIFETTQNIEQLEALILGSEKSGCYTSDAVNEIFRIMHTIKGSSAMMLYDNISSLSHGMEDLFFFIRENKFAKIDCNTLSDLIFNGIDFIKVELEKIKDGVKADGNVSILEANIKEFLDTLKQGSLESNKKPDPDPVEKQQFYIPPDRSSISQMNAFKATIFYEDGCEMENIRAFGVIHNLKEITKEVYYTPEDIIDNEDSVRVIREHGFQVFIKTEQSYDDINRFFNRIVFLRDLELIELDSDEGFKQFQKPRQTLLEESPIKVPKLQKESAQESIQPEQSDGQTIHQSIISVNVTKLDKLMDLVGEMVIAEAMVTQNPDLKGLELDNFHKAARQLRKITGELQDMVMSIRMVPLSTTFQKMHRIVRDMSKKLDKDVELELIGEETEVDKNIIEHISDPLMHLVRNSIDHGIEATEGRESVGKPKAGRVTLEAKNAGSDVLVIVKDDGRGLNKEKILKRAGENGLLVRPEQEMSDKEIYNLIFLPGFSTKDSVSEFSGRGVGMDVVIKNIEAVGGSVSVDSVEGAGSTVTLKIPLTLAIIDGMNIKVGSSCYTIPTTSIKQSFRPREADIIQDPDGNEMIMVRGQCYPILRIHQFYNVKTSVTDFTKGILVMVEQDGKTLCIFADELLGQQQVVVKALPSYIKNIRKVGGLAGCTLLGDGSISLILDIGGLINREIN